MLAFEDGPRANEAAACESHCAITGLRGPAGVEPLSPGAVRQVFDDAGRKAAGDAEGVGQHLGPHAQRRADGCGRSDHTEDRRRVKAGLVDTSGRDAAQPAGHFGADGDGSQQIFAAEAMTLAAGERRRNNDSAGVNWPALVSVVEILAVGGDAVDERGIVHAEARRMANRCTRSRTVDRVQHGLHVVLSTGGHAQARNIQQQP